MKPADDANPSELDSAIQQAHNEIQYCRDELKGKMDHKVGHGWHMTYGDLKLICDEISRLHALLNESILMNAEKKEEISRLKKQQPERVSQAVFNAKIKELSHINFPARTVMCCYPQGIIITDEGE